MGEEQQQGEGYNEITSCRRLLDYRDNEGRDVLFHPGRVLLQDFTGVPALVDLAAVRDAVSARGGQPSKVDSLCPADLVVDHSVQLDFSQLAASAKKSVAAAATKTARGKVQQAASRQPPPRCPHVPAPPPPAPTVIMHSTFPPPFFPPGPDAFYGPSQHPFFARPAAGQLYPVLPPNTALYSPPQFYATDGSIPFPLHSEEHRSSSQPTSSQPSDEIPTDNPGLPIQDEVCPFHHRISYWSGALMKSQESEFRRNEERFSLNGWTMRSRTSLASRPALASCTRSTWSTLREW